MINVIIIMMRMMIMKKIMLKKNVFNNKALKRITH